MTSKSMQMELLQAFLISNTSMILQPLVTLYASCQLVISFFCLLVISCLWGKQAKFCVLLIANKGPIKLITFALGLGVAVIKFWGFFSPWLCGNPIEDGEFLLILFYLRFLFLLTKFSWNYIYATFCEPNDFKVPLCMVSLIESLSSNYDDPSMWFTYTNKGIVKRITVSIGQKILYLGVHQLLITKN